MLIEYSQPYSDHAKRLATQAQRAEAWEVFLSNLGSLYVSALR